MPDEPILNAWGEPVEVEDPDAPGWVPPSERKDTDSGPDANALFDPATGTFSRDLPEPE